MRKSNMYVHICVSLSARRNEAVKGCKMIDARRRRIGGHDKHVSLQSLSCKVVTCQVEYGEMDGCM